MNDNDNTADDNKFSTPTKPSKQLPFMFGGVVGDIAGSTYERDNHKSEDCRIFRHGSHFTDDTILTLATAEHLLRARDGQESTYATAYQEFGNRYPDAGYGGNFYHWLAQRTSNPKPYNSYGNGSAMRVSPIGWAAQDLAWCLDEAKKSAQVTHNHPEGVKGAQAVAAAIFLARQGNSKDEIRKFVTERFGYDLDRTVAGIRPDYSFDVSCQGSVPESIIAFLDSSSFEDAIRKAISLGGDSDTIACIAGSIAQAFYGEIPSSMVTYCRGEVDASLLRIMDDFWTRYDRKKL